MDNMKSKSEQVLSRQISHHFSLFSPADILERAYHRKNDGVNHLQGIFEA
jgi:hypothetical protein